MAVKRNKIDAVTAGKMAAEIATQRLRDAIIEHDVPGKIVQVGLDAIEAVVVPPIKVDKDGNIKKVRGRPAKKPAYGIRLKGARLLLDSFRASQDNRLIVSGDLDVTASMTDEDRKILKPMADAAAKALLKAERKRAQK